MMFERTKGIDKDRCLSVTIVGDQGIGKTVLASTFPRPIFLRTEDGTMSIPGNVAMQSPILTSFKDMLSAIDAAVAVDKAGTVVIDSISTLDSIMESEIVASDRNAKTLNQAMGGYGAGARALASKMRILRSHCDRVLECGKHLVFISHSDVETITPIDTEAYNVLTLRMNKKSIPPFTDLVDCVAFLRLDVDVEHMADKSKLGLSSDERILHCHASASINAKNRLGIKSPLNCPEGTNPILDFVAGKISN